MAKKEKEKKEEEKGLGDSFFSPELLGNVGSAVISQIGKPPQFDRVQTCHLYGNRFRVNIWIVPEDKDTRGKSNGFTKHPIIKDSFFITTDSDGKIEAANPPLKLLYPPLPSTSA